MKRTSLKWMAVGAGATALTVVGVHMMTEPADLYITFLDPLIRHPKTPSDTSRTVQIANNCHANQYSVRVWGIDQDQVVQLSISGNSIDALNCTMSEAKRRKIPFILMNRPIGQSEDIMPGRY